MTAKFPFKLGARVFRFLYENFLFHDFSLQNFARGLKVHKCFKILVLYLWMFGFIFSLVS